MHHRLVLPLPPSFCPEPSTIEGYGVFDYSTERQGLNSVCGSSSQLCSQHPKLLSYVDQLCEFLRKTRLIQYNPDDFFCLMPHDGDEGIDNVEALRHPDGRVVETEELQYMWKLCSSFSELVPTGDLLFNELNVLIKDGPPPSAAECLQSFFLETRKLMLNRKRSDQNDAARLTLSFPCESAEDPVDGVEAKKQRCRRDRMMQALLGYGMGPKKQHEVRVMRDTTVDLITCCNRGVCPQESIRTVVNIGEGKGYVSRALALCDGLQVVGLDCNPAHKERAVERTSHLLHGCLTIDSSSPLMTGRDMINLLYEPKGRMATVLCTVTASIDWSAILRGHVRLLKDCECSSDENEPSVDDQSSENSLMEVECEEGLRENMKESAGCDNKHEDLQRQLSSATTKLQCLICGHILRRDTPTAITRHTRRHLISDHTTKLHAGAADVPSKETVDEWNRSLPVEGFMSKLLTTFFRELKGKRCGSSPCNKRSRCTTDGDGSSVSAPEAVQSGCVPYEKWVYAHLPRGTRAEIMIPNKEVLHSRQECDGQRVCKTDDMEERDTYKYSQTYVTIVGYDCAHNQHFIIRDDGRRKEALTLLQPCELEASASREYPLDGYDTPPPKFAWSNKVALLLRVQPFPKKITPAVRVPSLSNVVMMGLHTCGDLGSNICQLFTSCTSRGLVLVSCCWHALTNNGFPLSREFRQRGWRTEMLSLVLATQPFDMWATASPEGHRDSARLLFYRGVLKRLWFWLKQRWRRQNVGEHGTPYCCPLVDSPHLEPRFLRRMAKMKHCITLDMLYVEVCREYFSAVPDKMSDDKWRSGPSGQLICPICRSAQAKFMEEEENVAHASRMGREYIDKYFSSFIGLTVLRMWMCHMGETLLLLDRTFYLAESLRVECFGGGSAVSLVPLFDGSISPRMYAILARRLPKA